VSDEPDVSYPAAPGEGGPGAPSLALTIVVSILFGPFGLLAAARDSDRAVQAGADGGRYWVAWLATWMTTWVLLGFVVVIVNMG
jgi:hypothetical protein